jgi:peptide/nickel transport system substrate-binding protein
MGTRNIYEFQMLMYRTPYHFGSTGAPDVVYEQSIGEPPQWSAERERAREFLVELGRERAQR